MKDSLSDIPPHYQGRTLPTHFCLHTITKNSSPLRFSVFGLYEFSDIVHAVESYIVISISKVALTYIIIQVNIYDF